jgi:hypothetical protein
MIGSLNARPAYALLDAPAPGGASALLTVSPASLAFAAVGGSQSVTVTSNTDWTAVSSDDWVTVSPASGSNNGVINVTATTNTDSERTATITLTGGGVTQTVTVTQAVVGTVYSLEVSPVLLNFTATGSSQSVAVTSNVSWTAVSFDDWATVSPASGVNDGTVSITVAANTDNSRISYIFLSGGGLTRLIILKQAGDETGNEEVEASGVRYANGILTVNTPIVEQIDVYSIGGALLYQVRKPAGEAVYSLRHLPRGVLIARGSSGWTKKIVISD